MRWAMGQAEAFAPKPPAVEGFLPISALMADWLGYWQSPLPARMVRRRHMLLLGQPPEF
ncbi:MAG: hypothetical protein RDU24_01400 [Humidesulfovibrio sp.]|uniref:hypothetical protein n=1 Tax=Humidesulfovibrio sp. TaxID=2910988 RepID=UPI0027EEB0E6|nr:hypothetical protein [Humidesulfovibrio sp.]MDQ7834014.1 hypothetical protein [Humidesulfovibrio sp.]